MKYDSSMKYKWDNENVMDYAIKNAKHQEAVIIAIKLKKIGISTTDIARATGLSISEIEKL